MMRMLDFKCKATLKAAVAMSVCFLFAAVAAFGQQSVYLTAAPTTATMPDGTQVPMWGYFCGTPAAAIASGANSTAFTATTAFDGSLNLPVNGYIGKILTAGVVSGAVTSNTPTTLTVAGWYPNAGTSYTLTLPAWAASTAYTAGQLIVDSNGNVQMVTTAGTSAAAAPTAWGAAAGATTADGTVVWTFQRSATSAAATTSYTLTGATDTSQNMPVNAYVGATVTVGSITGIVASNTATTLTLSAAGWTGATPAANTAISAAASSAGCAALNPHSATPASVTPGAWVASHAYSVSSVILDSNGNVQMATAAGTSGTAAPPTWGTTAGATTTDGTGGLVWTFAGSLATYLSTATSWSPVVITVPTGQALTINLTNNLSFTPAGSATANNIPTSIVIVGQVGGGLGAPPTTTPSPSHAFTQGCPTWFIASSNTPPGTPCTTSASSNPGNVGGTNVNSSSTTPPAQGPRVQSMATEVTAGATTALTWASLKPGTYLLESGTHPSIQVPMGLIGVLVVTTAPTATTAGTAYPATATSLPVPYNAELPLEFSEIDPVQNKEVDQAVRTVGFSETAVWTRMTALGAVSALTLTNAGSGYTTAPTVTITAPTGGSPAQASASATVGALVATISVTAGGTGYSNAPTVTITDATGTGATAQAIVVGGVITGITVTNPGSFYTAPTVTITDPTGTGAGATAAVAGSYGVIYALNLSSSGEGYTAAPTVTITPPTTGTPATATAAILSGGCGGGAHTCYPPAVNYTPLYYLIDGVAFNKTNPANSAFSATAGGATTGITGTVLLRLVNAGLRMHTPSIVNSLTQGFNGAGTAATVAGFTLIAEDGNLLPNVAPLGASTVPAAPRVQTDVLMVPSKVFDALVNVPAASTCTTAPCPTAALPIYARDLALSGNSSVRDAGMLAYISVNNSTAANGLPVTSGSGIFAAAVAMPDTYNVLVAGQPFTVSDPSKGVIANDINVYGVALDATMLPASGTITCGALAQSTPTAGICANGTFTYTPNTGSTATSDSFGYCANGTTRASTPSVCTTVALNASGLVSGHPTAINQTYTANTATFVKIDSPGLLLGNTDPNGLPISVASSTLPACTANPTTVMCGNVDPQGGFTLVLPTPGTPPTTPATVTFTYTVQNSQGTQSVPSSTAPGTVTVTFPVPSNLQVKVLDAQLYNNCNGNSTCISGILPLTDYRWIIEEDRTFYVDPNCTTNSSISTPGCPAIVGPSGTSTIPTYGANFHTSHMNFVAQGCTGPLSCEGGQTMLDTRPACNAGSTTVPAGCSTTAGTHIPAVCDLGNGACRPDPTSTTPGTGNGSNWVTPSQVILDPTKRYYISVLPGDAANPFPANVNPPNCSTTGGNSTSSACGHTMSGAPIPPACNILVSGCTATSAAAFAPVNVLVLPTPLPTGKLSVIVFEDDWPLNGEQDGGGGNGTVAPIEPGLGSFNIVLWDTFGGLGDVTGQDTYDAFNQPLSNALAGTIDPTTGVDACPVSLTPLSMVPANGGPTGAGSVTNATALGGMTGTIVTCPKYEADNVTLSPLAGQAVIYNLMPDKFSVQAYPGADRIARGEQWFQTNTLDGQHPHDSFIRIGEPSYFQEYGPAGYHVAIGFANPAIINARHNDVCNGNGTPGTVGPCTNTITGQVNVQRLSRTPDQRLYPSGSHAALGWTECWVSLGDPDGEDFMFTMCDANGNFKFTNVPGGNWRVTIGDQWNDQIIDGLSYPANVGCTSQAPNAVTNASTCPGNMTANLGQIGVQQWQSNIYTHVFVDDNKNGIPDTGEIGIPFLYTRIYYRDGSNANGLVTDFNGIANFNETFPLFNWYVVEADSTRYKRTGIHTVYDAGGPADGSPSCGNGTTARQCGTSGAYNFLSNTNESLPLPADLSVPGAVYCAKADCGGEAATFAAGHAIPSSPTASTGRIDPPWVASEGWSGLTSHSNWIDFGFAPYAVNENGGIHGQVTYASTRPFDDADQMILQPWEPLVPGVRINLYQEGVAADNVTPTLTMVDTTVTSSWDVWAQGFYPNYTDSTSGTPLPYMSCPGQGTAVSGSPNQDLFFFTLFDQPNYLDWYNTLHSGGTTPTPLPYNSQFKCYDAMHIGNQLQPAPYDGEFSFPSSLGISPATGKLVTTMGATNGVTSNMPGTNCTICIPNPDATDVYRVGTPMLPPGKYVAEVVMPPGYEVYKEEDKNLLIGDNFIAPVTQQFGGLGAFIFIIPDQASVASLYDETASGYNPNNFQDQTTALGLGDELSGVPGYPGFQDPVWPCVGEMRVVPDYLSLFPQAKEVAPFAGATRPLCDRKEVTLASQMNVRMHFAIYTSTHIASKYTGGITDDFTSEFDPFAPQFGEKFAPPNMPVSTRDYLGNEIARVYSDHWGAYDGLTFSSWEVNPPNITGYSPTIMVQCMNDPGPIVDNRAGSATFGQLITDPLYNPAYSDFCYEQPFMPGLTNYTDTPVVPTQAFVGAGYNNVDCAYPDATPAVAEVDGDAIGPWVAAASGHTLTITALGNQQVNNSAYSGPSANVGPFNLKTVGRHYGFGTQCLAPAAGSTTCNTLSTVTIGGVPATVNSWSDTQIQVAVPTGVPNCAIQQQAQYGGSTAQCGQLLITAGNGKQSVDSVTVTIGGKAPTHVNASAIPGSSSPFTIQSAIDAAAPGDLIIIDPTCMTVAAGTTPAASAACSSTAIHTATPTQTASVAAHSEMLIMWKPVRLQGVGAVSSVISANANPAGKLLDPWRRHINCLFGLTLSGVPVGQAIPTGGTASYDPTKAYTCPDAGWNYFGTDLTGTGGGMDVANLPQIDRLPLEATIGWDATLNGNLAEQLQEPSLMGAFEGAGITVLAKGLEFHGAAPWTDGNEGGAFPTGTTLLTGVTSNPTATSSTFSPAPTGTAGAVGAIYAGTSTTLVVGDANPYCHTLTYNVDGTVTISNLINPYPSDFMCNPSSIDGLSVINSSQGGGGIFAHGWAHYLQVANNRVYNNAGTLTGGIGIGQGEFPTPYVVGGATTNAAPGSCSDGTGLVTNQHLPYCLQLAVNVHNNFITNNASLGDELFSGTLSGGGGATFCTGNDYYKFNYNWVCGNIAAGEGGGIVHLGEIQNGDIEHNAIALNQSDNPTIPTNGGGIHVQGTPDTDPVCGIQIDADCPPGLSDGTGHNLVINGNLIQGNMAESGSGGGIRLQAVNGTEVSTFPTQPNLWNNVSITNNMIVNNVAGWDGAGISLQDALNVSIINNTIASNDSLASSGVLTQSIGTPDTSAPAGSCLQAGLTTSCAQVAGVATAVHSTAFSTTLTGLAITCPFGEPSSTSASPTSCAAFSNPLLQSNVIWQNRSFYIGITGPGTGNQNQQNVVALFSANGSAAPSQTAYGQCTTGVSYWDIGVRGDTGPSNHGSGFSLNPTYSVLDDTGYASSNMTTDPSIIAQYCNGSRVPPTCTVSDGCGGPNGYGVPPGIADATAPNPVFSLNPNATVDEGNNWINVGFGPLSLSDDSVTGGANGNYGGGALFANYALNAGSPAIDVVPINTTTLPVGTIPQLNTDFYGNPRPDPGNTTHFDIGAVEFQNNGAQGGLNSITPNTGAQGSVVNVTITGTALTGATAVNVSGGGITVSNFVAASATTVTATFTISSTASATARNVTVTVGAATLGPVTFTVTAAVAPTLTSIAPASELRGTSAIVTLTGTNFTTTSTVNIPAGTAAGVAISGVTFVNSTTITAAITSTTTATLGPRDIYVANGGADSNSVAFTITGPVLTSISPVSGNRGTSFIVTLTGTGLTGATAVNVSGGGGITVTGVTPVSDTSVTATFTISATTSGGARNVSVTTSLGGTSNTVPFTIIVPPGDLTAISPNTGARGTAVNVTLGGTGFTGATAVNVSGPGVAVSNFVEVNDTTITATFTITATATLGARNVTVTNPTATPVTSNPVAFTVVTPGTPTELSISPNSGVRGTPQPVTLTGTGFTTTGTTVNVTAPANGLTITGVTIVNPTTITATFNTTATATIGAREIYVTTPGGATGTVVYTVTGPVLTDISPNQAVRGTAVSVSLFGSGLTGTTTVAVSGGGVTVSGVTVVNDTQVNATFTITATAAAGARNVTVTTPTGGGTSNAVAFTVIALPAPTLASIAPNTGVRGTTATYTLTGTDFTGATAVAISGGGVTCTGIQVLDPETAQANCAITTTASVTAARNVTITTGSGTSVQAVPFTVQGPTLTSISPTTGNRGTTVAVTFTGTNLQTAVAGTTTVTGLGGGVTASAVTVVNSTTVTANLTLAPTATLGNRSISLTTPIGTTNTETFTVTGATVTFSAPTPALTTTPANTTTKASTITVTNAATATGALTLTAAPTIGVTAGAADGTFSVTGGTCTSGTVVAPAGTCTVTFQYVPTTTGTATAHVTLTGTGIAAATINSGNFNAN